MEVVTGEIEIDSAALESVPPPRVAPPLPAPDSGADSRERLVAAHPARPVDEMTDVQILPPVVLREGERRHEVGTSVDVEEEPVEEPPTSSRRPIALEPPEPPLEELAFGDAPPPPAAHTPPPESGRQVAAPPVDLEFDGDSTGVRSRPDEVPVIRKPAEIHRPAEVALPPPVPPPKPAPPAPLAPEVTRASLEAKGDMASYSGGAPAFKPATFGDLLDATLKL